MRTKKQINSLKLYFFSLFFIIFLLFMIATSNSHDSFVTSNENNVKAVQSSRIQANYKNNLIETVPVNSLEELKNNINKRVKFTGTMTGYGPDCVGCSGKLGCPPHQDVRNGNIYYEDGDYGKIRILASDPLIPCGSIIKISNYYNEEFYGIVLDRGSAIKGLTMDLLYESEMTTKNIGRQYNIIFEIERWGFN